MRVCLRECKKRGRPQKREKKWIYAVQSWHPSFPPPPPPPPLLPPFSRRDFCGWPCEDPLSAAGISSPPPDSSAALVQWLVDPGVTLTVVFFTREHLEEKAAQLLNCVDVSFFLVLNNWCRFSAAAWTESGRKVRTVTPAWSLIVSSLCCRLHLLHPPPHPACRSQSLAQITIWRVGMGTTGKRTPPAPTWSTRHGRSSARSPSSPGALALLPHATTSPSRSPPASSPAWSTGTSLSPYLTTFLHFLSFHLWIPSPVAILLEWFEEELKSLWCDVWVELWWSRSYLSLSSTYRILLLFRDQHECGFDPLLIS